MKFLDPIFVGNGCKALELGCGQGWPGIALLSMGCHVFFSDFNAEALDLAWGNISLNCPEHLQNARCFAGDWLDFSKFIAAE